MSTLTSSLAAAFAGIGGGVGTAVADALAGLPALLTPINTLAAGLGTSLTTPLSAGLSALVGLQVNKQTSAAGTFTETALVIGLIPATALAAVVNLAASSVGPNGGPIPTSTGLTPPSGPTAGGTTVTVTGTNFTPGTTVAIDGGAPITPSSIAPDGTSLTFVTPPHAAGPVAVTVTNATGTSGPQAFTFIPPAPTARSLTPPSGPTAGGTTVTITGTNFVPGSTVAIDGGAPITPTSIAPDGTSLTFVTPAHAVGPVGVTVTTLGGTTTPALTFTFVPPPTARSLTPPSGPTAGGTTVTITGTNFVPGSTVAIDGGAPITPTSIAPDGRSLTFVTPAHAAGPVGVTVTTTGGTTGPQTFNFAGFRGVIPATGTDAGSLAWYGLLLLVLGAALVETRRRLRIKAR